MKGIGQMQWCGQPVAPVEQLAPRALTRQIFKWLLQHPNDEVLDAQMAQDILVDGDFRVHLLIWGRMPHVLLLDNAHHIAPSRLSSLLLDKGLPLIQHHVPGARFALRAAGVCARIIERHGIHTSCGERASQPAYWGWVVWRGCEGG